MKNESSPYHSSSKISILKVLLWILAAGFLFCVFILLSPQQIGPIKKMRVTLLLEYTGIIKDKRSDAELAQSLKNNSEIDQFNAISAIAHRRYSPENAEALVEYLKADIGTKRAQNHAVWALGELHAQEAKEFLLSLKSNEKFNSYEVQKALKKIDGKIPKPFWRK